MEPPLGTSIMVGVGTSKAMLHTDNYQFINLLGKLPQLSRKLLLAFSQDK